LQEQRSGEKRCGEEEEGKSIRQHLRAVDRESGGACRHYSRDDRDRKGYEQRKPGYHQTGACI
jgi:hypothetical protein